MNNSLLATQASKWALNKVGCQYSQPNRTAENIFDCSSLVARAYMAQGKQWKFGGPVPLSNQEVYDDDFELLWPDTYDKIGKKMGGASVISLAQQPGDLQFLCTDSNTKRSNRITHVAMTASPSKIVHARGKTYGVCTNSLNHYNGKVCAISRYNPDCTLRIGMKGFRTQALQNTLNAHGAGLETDGDFGRLTEEAVRKFQKAHGLKASGNADSATLHALGLLQSAHMNYQPNKDNASNKVLITGEAVNIRHGPSTDFPVAFIANEGDAFEMANAEEWFPIQIDNQIYWVSAKYSQVEANGKQV